MESKFEIQNRHQVKLRNQARDHQNRRTLLVRMAMKYKKVGKLRLSLRKS